MLDSASIAMIVGLVFCVIMSGYFSATETAFTSLNRVRLKSWADGGDQRAARTLALAEDYDKLLSTLLIGNNIVNNVATTIGAVLFIHLIDEVTGPTVSAIVLTVVILIFGEVSPKSLAKESPERFAMFATPLLGGAPYGPYPAELPVYPVEAAAVQGVPQIGGRRHYRGGAGHSGGPGGERGRPGPA